MYCTVHKSKGTMPSTDTGSGKDTTEGREAGWVRTVRVREGMEREDWKRKIVPTGSRSSDTTGIADVHASKTRIQAA